MSVSPWSAASVRASSADRSGSQYDPAGTSPFGVVSIRTVRKRSGASSPPSSGPPPGADSPRYIELALPCKANPAAPSPRTSPMSGETSPHSPGGMSKGSSTFTAFSPIWKRSSYPVMSYGGSGGPPGYWRRSGYSLGSIRSTTYGRKAWGGITYDPAGKSRSPSGPDTANGSDARRNSIPDRDIRPMNSTTVPGSCEARGSST